MHKPLLVKLALSNFITKWISAFKFYVMHLAPQKFWLTHRLYVGYKFTGVLLLTGCFAREQLPQLLVPFSIAAEPVEVGSFLTRLKAHITLASDLEGCPFRSAAHSIYWARCVVLQTSAQITTDLGDGSKHCSLELFSALVLPRTLVSTGAYDWKNI